MPKFRKRPPEVEAEQWHPGVKHDAVQTETLHSGTKCFVVYDGNKRRIELADGDWILTAENGAHFVCPDAQFNKLFEPATPFEDAVKHVLDRHSKAFSAMAGTDHAIAGDNPAK